MNNIIDYIKTEPSVWKTLADENNPVVLYGMGDGADKVLAVFEKLGINACGVMASDEFVRGQSYKDFTVKKLSDFEAELNEFTVALCFASQLPNVMDTIKRTANKHKLFVPSVPVFGNVIFDDNFVNENKDDIIKAYSLLEDAQSRRVYKNVLRFYYSGKIELLDEITTDKSEAFEKILKLNTNEVYVDLGAYNGDTIDEFLKYSCGEYRKIIALEPNEKNYSKLVCHCSDMKRVQLWQLGAYKENTVLRFNNKAGRNSAISEKGIETKVAAVDSLLCGISATYVKADVEGADFETLEGMKNTLQKSKPKLNYSVYHRFEDIFRLPLYIKEINPDYKIYLRHHPYIPAWDTNLYCI